MFVLSSELSVKTRYLVLLLSMILLSVSVVWGTEESEKKEEIPLFTEKVEVVGNIPVANTIQSVSVLKVDEIEPFHFESMKSVLNLIPGLLTLSNGSFGQSSSTYIRGSKSSQVLYIVDGIKLRDGGSLSGVDLAVLSPAVIDKVEVVRGPLSSIYGSDAMGGVISLSTHNKEGATLTASYGSSDSYMGTLSALTQLKDLTLGMSINSQRFSDDIPNDVFKNTGLSAKADYNKNKWNTGLRFFGNFTDSGIPFNDSRLASPNRKYKQTYMILALPVTYQLTNESKINLKLSFSRSRYQFQDTEDVWNPYYVSRFTNYEGELTYSTSFFKRFHLDVGADYADQNVLSENSFGYILDNKKTSFFSAFTNAGIDLNELQLNASVRYDKYKNVPAHVSPQFGLSYLLANRLKLRASYAFSFMAPMVQQQVNPWGVANFSLNPEKGKSLEMGIEYYSAKAVFAVTYFNTRYQDMIEWVTVDWTTFMGQFQNVKNVDTYGVELSATLHPFTALTLNGSYTYLHTQDKETHKPLVRKPKHTFSGFASYAHKRFTFSINMIYVGERPDLDYSLYPPDVNAPAFATFDLCLLVPVSRGVSLYGKLSNALNKQYQQMYGYDAPGRRFELGCTYQLR